MWRFFKRKKYYITYATQPTGTLDNISIHSTIVSKDPITWVEESNDNTPGVKHVLLFIRTVS